MLIESYGQELVNKANVVLPVAPMETPLGATATEILEMFRCYASDGMVFHRRNDPVNAIASFAYGHGWLDTGIFLGYLLEKTTHHLPKITERIPEIHKDHLTEKTYRYQRMLSSALTGIVIYPDTETQMGSAAQYIKTIVVSARTQGCRFIDGDDLVSALVSISYGYGWLDCGIRAGLFGISGDRKLFTI
ncbi:MAG TPA: DUF357 domain-containing protein [Methanocorpusculum sp.]|nr:DUF357 domain-containing protein [Methanocorpusculum sp.]